jgi:hypothetical protein
MPLILKRNDQHEAGDRFRGCGNGNRRNGFDSVMR